MGRAPGVSGIIAASLLSVALQGCVVAPAQPYYAGEPVYIAPPAPQVEYVGAPPAVGLVWIGGYWNWAGGRHAWVGGHWEAPPRPGHRWVPHQWARERNAWRLHRGHWEGR
jgi:hypothetical protein